MTRPTAPPVPSGTFEADLRATREARGLSLPEIQQQTRIPVDVLRRFEDGDLVGDPTYNEVYLKAFLQSYAKAVGLPPSAVVTAYGAQKAGSYAGALHPDYEPGSGPTPPTPQPSAEAPASERAAAAPRPPEAPRDSDGPRASEAPPPAAPPQAPSSAPPAVQALRQTPPASARPAPAEAPKTLAQARVNRPTVPSARRSFDKNWTTILALFGVIVVALGLAFYFLIFAGDDADPEDEGTVAVSADAEADPIAIDSSGIGAGAAGGGPQLQFPIRAVVTAGGDGLQWFRVTQDGGERTPYWIDGGTSQTFEADSSLVLWGEGNEDDTAYAFEETTVEIQGQRFTPASGRALRVDRQAGQRLLDSLATAAPAPPSAPSAGGAAPPPPAEGAYE